MTRQPIESSNIRSIGVENGTIEVEFKHGGVYQYPDCDPETCQKFLESPSKGTFFAQHLKHRPFKKVDR